MKFGGTSVADAARMMAVAEIVRGRLPRRPVVVVSALAGVTDLLERAIEAACAGRLHSLDPILADLERRHRWAVAKVLDDAGARHDLALAVDGMFEEVRQKLRSVRVLGEVTPRARDALLACGEHLATRILVDALRGRGLASRRIDAREVMITDGRHGDAEPDADAVAARVSGAVLPAIENGEVPVLGGFIGATTDGRTTTLGRGGSDTSAAVLGAALGVEEIEIWSDVDGLMSADPTLVPGARTLASVSFKEAAELAYYGARVLHPSSLAPAVTRGIPVRILNSLRPDGAGTVILSQPAAATPRIASVASRGGVTIVRARSRRLRMDPTFLPGVLGKIVARGFTADLVVASELSVTLAVSGAPEPVAVADALGEVADAEATGGHAIVCVVGTGLGADAEVRRRVVSVLASLDPDLVALGRGASSVAAVFPEDRLAGTVREMHRQFFEAVEAA